MPEWGPLGEVLRRSTANAHNVERATEEAAALLKAVRDTFPAYTLHDEQHALNVVRLMGELALPRIADLKPLEAALLILSAYFHDIGMVYSDADRAKIPHEEEFREFLARDAEAFLAVRQNGDEPTPAVLEKYCRLRHADRVRVHLDRLDQREPGLLKWDGMSLVSILGKLCESHNLPTADILTTFDRLFLTDADTRFCAMLLRLADIMDFDRTRTPLAIHEYLGFASRDSATLAESEQHWQKHLASGGFSFPPIAPGNRPDRYTIDYAANPTNPGVEHDIRLALAEVGAELDRCRRVRDDCPRWRELPLPGDIDAGGIEGIGYTYGDFHFALDRAAVLELFTGEELYEDPQAFLRELLQNAIDAVQTRLVVHGEIPDSPAAVDVTCWEGRDGFLWVRVDDTGIGMDERLIKDYFLRVGRSYYNSAEFRAEQLREGRQATFTPISRFGIGVLSCFMAGDRVEVSTRRLLGHRQSQRADVPLRLSLHRDRDYFVLRRKGQGADDMPGARKDDGFRTRTGTSIAVRIDPNRTGIELQGLIDKVDEYVFAPPVPVSVNGRPANARALQDAERPWLDRPVVVSLRTDDQMLRGDAIPYLGGLQVVALPLDLSRTAAVTSVAGQLLAVAALPPEADIDPGRDLLAGWPSEPAVDMDLSDALHRIDYDVNGFGLRNPRDGEGAAPILQLEVGVWRWFSDSRLAALTAHPDPADTDASDDIAGPEFERASAFLHSPPALRAALRDMADDGGPLEAVYRYGCEEIGMAAIRSRLTAHMGGLGWAHGGIVLPSSAAVDPSGPDSQPSMLGVIHLQGPLRPDATVSRDAVRAVPLAVHSALHMAVRMAATGLDAPPAALEQVMGASLINIRPRENCSTAVIGEDRLVAQGAWNREAVIPVAGGLMSVDELRAATSAGRRVPLRIAGPVTWEEGRSSTFHFYDFLPLGLLQLFCGLSLEPVDETCGVLFATESAGADRVSALLPPLYAVEFLTVPAAVARAPLAGRRPHMTPQPGACLNATHPLVRWVSDNTERLARDFAAPFNRVLRRAPWVRDPNEINAALDRVANARTDIPAPPHAAYVRADENGWWVSR